MRPLTSRDRKLLVLAGLTAFGITAGVKVARLDAGGMSGSTFSPCARLATPVMAASGGSGPVHLQARLDRSAVLAGAPGELRLEVTLSADRGTSAARRPTDFYVVFDRSGSMEGYKIDYARRAVLELLDQIGPDDRFALFSYASEARVDIPLSPPSRVPRKLDRLAQWREQVQAIEAGGGTAMSYGLDLALDAAGKQGERGRVARLLLLSDGLANEGDFSPEGLQARARSAAASGIPVTTLGIGDDFNEELMTDLADVGLGNYYYLPDADQIATVMSNELQATRETVAEEIEVALVPAPGVTIREIAGYPLVQRGDHVVFHPGTLFAGQERRLWVTLDTLPVKDSALRLTAIAAAYTSKGARKSLSLPSPLQVGVVATADEAVAAIDRDVWGRAVVEEEYGKLQTEVAASVRAGKREEARGRIAAYQAKNSALNAQVQNEVVTHNLNALQDLEAQVDGAFSGADQEAKQKGLAKAQQAQGYDARRVGSKMGSSKPPGGGSN